MSAPKPKGASHTIARVAIGSGELRVILYPEANPAIDLRWFEPGGGPAAVPMPTHSGLAFPVQDAGEIIEAIQRAEMKFRRDRLGGGH